MRPTVIFAATLDGWVPVVRGFLEDEGFDVEIVKSFRGLREHLAQYHYDLVCPTNENVNERERIPELVSEIRACYPGIGIIVISGYADLSSAIDFVRRGVDDFVALPFDVDDLITTFRRVLTMRGVLNPG